MRFKKLELLGFKSFAEATEFSFEPGVTAIVGPNGCGKSNIADGIKWVLGEQSPRELRGGRMEDLIFNGSDRRDPVHYAEVTLTLDNADKALPIDYTEVSISRRLFRSGESEYVLNGTPVRLKDIQELLMGTGIGTSAYSLFEQGRIEQIISARPEERRAVFEEAAGITKFKSQKREALRKLEETEDNLARVSDVIAEVKRQIQAMERQVRRAKAYQERWEELKRLEMSLARRQTRALDCRWNEKQAALESFQAQAGELESCSGAQEDLLRQARSTVAEAEEALSKAKEMWLSAKARLETLRSNLEMNRERIAEAQARQAQIRRVLEEAGSRTAQLDEQRGDLAQTILRQENERQGKQSWIAQCQSRLDSCGKAIEETQRLMTETRERILETTGLQVQVKNHLAEVRQEAARLEARTGRLQSELQKVAVERQEASREADAVGESLLQGRTILEDLEAEGKLCRENLEATERTLEAVQQEVRGLEQEQTRCASQIEVLKSLVATHEGYSNGVKALLTALDQGRLDRTEISGVLAEVLQVGHSEVAAVDAALGPWTEAVVVESASVADRCREFLERSHAGRVLFFIRDRIPSHPSPFTPSPLPEMPGAVRLFDRIGITPHLEPLLKFLLADVWLVSDRDAAEKLLPHLTHPCSIVTLAGEMYTAASALMGSAPVEEGMVVGRMSRLQSLEITIDHVEGKLEEVRERQRMLQAQRQTQQEALQGLEERCREKLQEIQRQEAGLSSAKAALEKLEQEEALLKAEHSEAAAELVGVHAEVHQAEEGLTVKEQEAADLETVLHRAQETLDASVRVREQTSVEFATASAELASLEQVAASRRASLAVLEESLQAVRNQISSGEQELSQWQERQGERERASADLERTWAQLEAQRGPFQAGVDEGEARRTQTLEAARVQEEEFLVLRRKLEQLQTQLHAQEMEQAQVAFQKEQIASRLQQVYQTSLNSLEGSDPEGVDPNEGNEEGLRTQIEELSQKLERIGPVNLGSIEEAQELQGRHDYLMTQQNDLLKAKEDLHEALTKINRTTRAMFRETFQAIQKEFQETFKQLFGGGEARLVLMDEEDVLESGIEIIARPPGKPLQPISLLSGGEKALTTIALLFAIFRVKPSPFCLLDEIDAPLDESNIDRFTRALKQFLRDSQFIIITHNKKTISMADVMYGVTMQEMGVSKIISAKFKEKMNGNGNGNGSIVSPAASSEPPAG